MKGVVSEQKRGGVCCVCVFVVFFFFFFVFFWGGRKGNRCCVWVALRDVGKYDDPKAKSSVQICSRGFVFCNVMCFAKIPLLRLRFERTETAHNIKKWEFLSPTMLKHFPN